MTDDEPLHTGGGWCAPTPTIYGLNDWGDFPRVELPEVPTLRGGIRFDRSPADLAAYEAMRARTVRLAVQLSRWRHDTIEAAAIVAAANDWDVHIWPHHEHRYQFLEESAKWITTHRIGIEFRPAEYAIPTIVEHEGYDATYDWDDE